MTTEVSERAFEDAIEAELLTPPAGAAGYQRRSADDFDRQLCLIPRDVLDFVYATQPLEWDKLKQHHRSEVKEKFLARLAREIERRGCLDVLRNGIKDSGCRFELAYFRPASGLNEAVQRRYQANVFSVARQLHYSQKNENSLDVGLFLNGIPIFTAELKNPLTGQNVQHAIRQYKYDRDPREPLLAFRRCLAHFAVDPDLVYMTTRLAGPKTRFLPLNRGKFGGAGNPPVLPTESGYSTSYLWREIWSRDSVLNLIRQFIQEIEEEDEHGKKTGERLLVFPRYHQLDAVQRMVEHAREHGCDQRYLIQHSAGSGKTFTIAWLAHQLSILHDEEDRRVFDSIVVISDRRVLDRQLQGSVRQFQQTLGVVENIDKTSRQLKEALESGKTIIVSTLQKYPVIADQIGALSGKRFAVIVDEAHSSQSGESTKSLKSVLAVETLEEAEAEEAEAPTPDEELHDAVLAEIRKRGRQPNVSMFAFTATPKPKTLELFGTRRRDGKFEPFSLYTMRQAIEEGFILDVLENYTTYKAYWKLLKTIKDDPHYDSHKAIHLLKAFVYIHEHPIRKKMEIIVEHFNQNVARRIDNRAKAMIVTRSRLHAVRYRRAVDKYLRERDYPYKALVAFSGTVRDAGADYTEANMNGIPEVQTAATFKAPEYRFLIVANKFQTGFDQPLLHTMYVDKKLGGVNAVQTLSRLNRTHAGKSETMVLDFANEAQEIQEAFEPYYEKTLLSEATDPNLLYDLQQQLAKFDVYTDSDVENLVRIYFRPRSTQDQLYAALVTAVERFGELPKTARADFRGKLADYVRLYAFLSQVLTFADADLEKLYVFARLLRRRLPVRTEDLPREIQQHIDMDSFRLQETSTGTIGLSTGQHTLEPQGATGSHELPIEDIEPLSQIITELNDRFGTDFSDDDKVFIRRLQEKLAGDPALIASVQTNRPENARLTFDHVANDRIQEMINTNFKFYQRINEDKTFAKFFLDWMFDQFREAV